VGPETGVAGHGGETSEMKVDGLPTPMVDVTRGEDKGEGGVTENLIRVLCESKWGTKFRDRAQNKGGKIKIRRKLVGHLCPKKTAKRGTGSGFKGGSQRGPNTTRTGGGESGKKGNVDNRRGRKRWQRARQRRERGGPRKSKGDQGRMKKTSSLADGAGRGTCGVDAHGSRGERNPETQREGL